jgi:hypothetical protein
MSSHPWGSRTVTAGTRRGRVRSGRRLSGLVVVGRVGGHLVLDLGLRRGRRLRVEEEVTREGGMIIGRLASMYLLVVIVLGWFRSHFNERFILLHARRDDKHMFICYPIVHTHTSYYE